ncbi:hypothetical protein [Robertkochia marina]|nr:hypothetical protein [Robertkochia marina]
MPVIVYHLFIALAIFGLLLFIKQMGEKTTTTKEKAEENRNAA